MGASRPFHVDVRVVMATHRELRQWVRQGHFREDLYYRLNLMPVVLPPLRSRRGDLRLLAEHFLRAHAPQGQSPKLTAAALARLQQHAWPGNIRELRHVVCRALMLRRGPHLVTARPTPMDETSKPPKRPVNLNAGSERLAKDQAGRGAWLAPAPSVSEVERGRDNQGETRALSTSTLGSSSDDLCSDAVHVLTKLRDSGDHFPENKPASLGRATKGDSAKSN